MPRYTLLNGAVVEYDPTPEVSAYLARMHEAFFDPSVSWGDLNELLFAEDNPVIATGVFPGRGHVTREVAEDPVYQVMNDLCSRKMAAESKLDASAAAARHTMSVRDAAEQLGISTSAIRQAIASGRLEALKQNGQWWLSPTSVSSYRPSSRGPSPASRELGGTLRVVRGAAEGAGLKLWHDGQVEQVGRDGDVVEEIVTGWTRAAVFTYVKGRGSARFFELAPGDSDDLVQIGPLEVAGRFRVARKVNNARKASEAFALLSASA